MAPNNIGSVAGAGLSQIFFPGDPWLHFVAPPPPSACLTQHSHHRQQHQHQSPSTTTTTTIHSAALHTHALSSPISAHPFRGYSHRHYSNWDRIAVARTRCCRTPHHTIFTRLASRTDQPLSPSILLHTRNPLCICPRTRNQTPCLRNCDKSASTAETFLQHHGTLSFLARDHLTHTAK